jgi:hypothetical protein
MATQHKPGLAIVIGVGKPKSPPPRFGTPDGGPSGPVPQADGHGEPDADDAQRNGGKSSLEEAACFGPEVRCASCTNYQPGDTPDIGTCAAVDGDSFGPGGQTVGCVKYFEPNSAAGGESPAEEAAEQPSAAAPPQGAPYAS